MTIATLLLSALLGVLLSIAGVHTTDWYFWAILVTVMVRDVLYGKLDRQHGYEQGYDKGFAEAADEHRKGNWE